jgi:hypothetical protein
MLDVWNHSYFSVYSLSTSELHGVIVYRDFLLESTPAKTFVSIITTPQKTVKS